MQSFRFNLDLFCSEYLCFSQHTVSQPSLHVGHAILKLLTVILHQQSSHWGNHWLFDGSLWLNEKWELSIDRINRHSDVYLSSFTSHTHTHISILDSGPCSTPDLQRLDVCTIYRTSLRRFALDCCETEEIGGHQWFIIQPTHHCEY